MTYDIKKIKGEFPILKTKVNGKQLVYFDHAATSQKPQSVIDSIVEYYTTYNSNIHRGIHTLSQKATGEYERARKKVTKFLHAKSEKEIVFTRGTTESINLIATTYGLNRLKENDEIILSVLEHHSNIVPWQEVARKTGAMIKVIPLTSEGKLDYHAYEKLLSIRTKIVSVAHVSNALGTINDVKKIVAAAKKYNALTIIDGAQAVGHIEVDVRDIGCDAYTFSGHKMYGPMGIGILYVKEEVLRTLPPYQTGGEMILSVSFEKTIFKDIPEKFEAGTPNVCGAIALGAAIEFIEKIGIKNISTHEQKLRTYATKKLLALNRVKIIGNANSAKSGGIISFTCEGIHPHDIGTLLDQEGIAIRTGHHCAEPLMKYLKLPGTSRISFGMYNTQEEIDSCITALKKTLKLFS